MLYTTESTHIAALDGRKYPVAAPLVARTSGRPNRGWSVILPIKGQNVKIEGATPHEVYNRALVLYRRNGQQARPQDLWLTLNIQWLSRMPARMRLVPLENVMQAAGLAAEPSADPSRRNYKPADWGRYAWGWLNLFLAREDFNYREFMEQLRYVLDILNPDTNPEIGCAECFRDFTIAVAAVENQPGMTRDQARHWLVDAHNEVNRKIGKPALSFSQAAKAAFWI